MQLFNVTIPMAAAGTLVLNFGAKQSYSSTSGSNPWNVYFYVNGNFVTTTGGSRAATDSVSLVGAYKDLPAGDHNVTVEWNANGNINISNMTLVVQASYK